MRRALLGIAAVIALAGGAARAQAATPVVFSRPVVTGIALDSTTLGWRTFGSGTRPCRRVHHLRLATNVRADMGRCGIYESGDLIAETSGDVFFNRFQDVNEGCCEPKFESRVREWPAAPVQLASYLHARRCGGDEVTAMDAAGGTLAYSVLSYIEVDPQMICVGNPQVQGDDQATGGRIELSAPGGPPAALAGAPPAPLIATGGGRVALVPYALPGPVDGTPAAQHRIEVWDAGTDSLVRAIAATASVRGVATDGTWVLATLSGAGAVCWNVATGAQTGTYHPAGGVHDHVAMAGGHGAATDSRGVVEIDPSNCTATRIWRVPAGRADDDVAIRGGRVAWVEQHHVVFTAVLP
jgi:hypothetical protein